MNGKTENKNKKEATPHGLHKGKMQRKKPHKAQTKTAVQEKKALKGAAAEVSANKKNLQKEQLFRHQQNEIVKSPNNIVPACTVPESGEKPNCKNIADIYKLGATIASKGDVNIFPEPCSKGNMPPTPEFCDAF